MKVSEPLTSIKLATTVFVCDEYKRLGAGAGERGLGGEGVRGDEAEKRTGLEDERREEEMKRR